MIGGVLGRWFGNRVAKNLCSKSERIRSRSCAQLWIYAIRLPASIGRWDYTNSKRIAFKLRLLRCSGRGCFRLQSFPLFLPRKLALELLCVLFVESELPPCSDAAQGEI